jgi:hypothetical protein
MKKIHLFLLLAAPLGFAQDFEIGKVSKAELEEKSHPTEPDAAAAILFEKGTSYMSFDNNSGFMLITDVDVRIKIYKKEGYDWANKQVRYYIGGSQNEKVEFSKAVTYNLVNGNIEKTKLKSEGEFDEKVNKFWGVRKIAMPNVREGSVIEYRYRIESPYLSALPSWHFQNTVPVNYSDFTTKIPEYFVYKVNFKGSLSPETTQTKENRTHQFTTKERTGMYISKTEFSRESLSYIETITDYAMRNLPSVRDEEYVSNIWNYASAVDHELSVIKYPNQPIKDLSTDWPDVVRTIYNAEDFGNEVKKTGYFESDIAGLLAGKTDQLEKLAAIFSYVKSRMNWDGYYGYSCDEGVRKAYNDKVGGVAEINLMLTAMLRYAGLKANPVLVSTRANGIPIFPNRNAFNYVIAAVEFDSGYVLLDATAKSTLPNILPVRALNWMGRLVRDDGSSALVELMPTSNSRDIVTMMATLAADGTLSGKIREQYFDYNAFLFRENLGAMARENYLGALEKKLSGIEIGEYDSKHNDFSQPVTESYSFSKTGSVEILGDKIYLNPMFFFAKTNNPFTQEKREYPVDFIFPHQDKYMITVSLPDGYTVESVPQPAAVSMEELGIFKYQVTAANSKLQVLCTMDINKAIIGPEDYEGLKNFYKAMIEKQNEKIVLKKV